MSESGAKYISAMGISKKKANQIKTELSRLQGVNSVAIGTDRNTISVDFNSSGTNAEEILNTISKQHEGFIQQG